MLALSFGLAAVAGAETVDPAAIRVINGDTIEQAGQSVRLVGFDTPETRRALGNQATARFKTLVRSGAIVEVFMLPGRDRYSRGLGRLHVAGWDMGDVLIAEGLA